MGGRNRQIRLPLNRTCFPRPRPLSEALPLRPPLPFPFPFPFPLPSYEECAEPLFDDVERLCEVGFDVDFLDEDRDDARDECLEVLRPLLVSEDLRG